MMARLIAVAGMLAAAPVHAQAVNDYPTNARAEYVFACMATNGQTRDMLDRCSCAIDQIAEVLPYDAYVEAETVLRMQQTTGERAGMFRSMPQMTEIVAGLKRAEAEAEILCF
jgi:lysyl-tRNA synthetase class II